MKSNIVFFFALVPWIGTAKLPSYVTKCSFNDPKRNECILKSAREAYPMLIKGDNAIHMRNCDPLKIPRLTLDVKGNLLLDLKNLSFLNNSNAVLTDVDINFDKKTFSIKLTNSFISILADYKISGRLLLLPITGSGGANVTYVGGNYTFDSSFEIVEKKGNHYIHITKAIYQYKPKKAYFDLENLFDGNKALGDQMLNLMNENWEDVNEEIGSKVGEAMAEIFAAVLNDLFAKVPLEELFTDYK